ncbi:MAG: hypothetical protein CL677_04240 [Bdellovibrionaceae bacterium]|nr:hypothetical protein [Pseudobdellovibrionaceae bacterium]|tara:strand:+ start:65900 stop:67822 length:1923 start_codon:yes stop_codon:yes gene_type:complete
MVLHDLAIRTDKFPMKKQVCGALLNGFLVVMGLALVGCGGSQSSSGGGSLGGTCELNGRISTEVDGPTVPSYCSGSTTYSGGVTITGAATYQARQIDYDLVSPTTGLLDAGSANPIRYAEVTVEDSSGNQVQCTETDASGNFSFDLPNNSSTYTVKVHSRANNSNYKAYVMNCPEENEAFYISGSVTPDSSKSIGTLNAPVTGEIIGGAFNILDQVLNANDYLRTATSGCSSVHSTCSDFSVAPLANIYWDPGFNPGYYSGSSSSGTSFYTPSSKRLFILGGINGDTDNTDTDHFDNSVIIHEYGHFLEDNVFASDSPGGSHSLDRLIDPRLAWSEGFANFMQAAVLDVPRYIDTYGNVDGSTGEYFRLNLERQTGTYYDEPINTEEGNFRELSITRMLWDAIDTDDDGSESTDSAFSEIWAVISSSEAGGFLGSSSAFRSVGLFHDFQTGLSSGTDWSGVRANAKQREDRLHYARYMDTTGVCGSGLITIVPQSNAGNVDASPGVMGSDPGGLSTSHLLLNNDFYHYKHDGGTLTVTLTYTTASGTEADLDLYVYSSNGSTTFGRFGTSNDIINNVSAEEGLSVPNGTVGDTETEQVSQSVPAGDYLINVNVYTGDGAGSSTDYALQVGGTVLCPADLP